MRQFLKLSALTGMLTATLLAGCLGDSSGSSDTAAAFATQAIANPAVAGPVTGGMGIFVSTTRFPLAQVGYTQSEYFLSGNATGYEPVGALDSDGKWNVKAATHADYKTRIVVYRPTVAAKFNGTVVVEWLNVSGGLDAGPDWIMAHNELIRQGYAWVGVSAQKAGIDGGGNFSVVNLPLKKFDPKRYGTLVHPGDAFSYDIFSQAAQAVRHPQGIDPLDGLKIKKMIAAGESQSAFRMVAYVNAIAPLNGLFDGFFIHSRPQWASDLTDAQTPGNTLATVYVRDDIAPVLIFETESDLLELKFYYARQPDSANVRTWEVAGTAHADTYTVAGAFDKGGDPKYADVTVTTSPVPGLISCGKPINSGPQHFVVNAAFAALNRWITTGTPPPSMPQLQIAGSPPAFVSDAYGNTLGGIRTPYVDAPVAKLLGNGQSGSINDITNSGQSFCFLFGTTTMFDSATLHSLYPDHASYVSKVNAATDSAVAQGYVLEVDGTLIKEAAQASTIGN